MSDQQNNTQNNEQNNTDKKYAPKYTVYKPNKSFKGSASQLELSRNGIFWVFANQLPEDNANGNAQFDWKGKLTVSIGDNDLATLVAFFTKPTDQEVKLFHETPSGGNKIVSLKFDKDKGYSYINVSFKNGDNRVAVSHFLTFGEALIVRQLLLNAISKIYW